MELSLTQQLDLERMLRAIDACEDITQLRCMSKQLARAWMTQQAAARWAMRQGLPRASVAPVGGTGRAPHAETP